MAGPATKQTRRSRITAACMVCRAKRQKCSGEKPVCNQCRTHNEDCQWSDQKKRGPVKDYLRSLQDRLQETENLLLDVLATTDDAELRSAISVATPKILPSHQTWINDLSGPQHWSQFPLTSTEDIRTWQAFRLNQRNGSASDDQATLPDDEDGAVTATMRARRSAHPKPGSKDTETRLLTEIKGCRSLPLDIQHGAVEQQLHTGFEVEVAENGDDGLTQQANDQMHVLPHNLRPRKSNVSVSSERRSAHEAAPQGSDTGHAGWKALPTDFPRHLFW